MGQRDGVVETVGREHHSNRKLAQNYLPLTLKSIILSKNYSNMKLIEVHDNYFWDAIIDSMMDKIVFFFPFLANLFPHLCPNEPLE